jgi:tetratricopeptide (TPR) repeat protein
LLAPATRGFIFWGAFAVAAAGVGTGCAHQKPAVAPPLSEVRDHGRSTGDPEVAASWLLGELMSPGGTADAAVKARARLDSLGAGGMVAALARALDDGLHGRLGDASVHYLEAVERARDSRDERAPLVAWFGANRAVALSHDAPALYEKWHGFVDQVIADPRSIGWRARSELVEWALDEASSAGATDADQRGVTLYGCMTKTRLAGPFGRGAAVDAVRHFSVEDPGPWPVHFPTEVGASRPPRVVTVESHSCSLKAENSTSDGIYYAETYFDLPDARDVILAVQGTLALRVDDALVLDRDVRQWGVWPKFGVALHLGAGRHRIVARLSEPSTSIRLMHPDGTPMPVKMSTDSSQGYSLDPPVVTEDPNVLARFIHGGVLRDPGDDLVRFLGGFMAHVESSDDVASVFVGPLIKDLDQATGPALSVAALFAGDDPIFESSQATDLVRELHERATKKDPHLWASRLSLALGVAESKGAEEAVPELGRLAVEFPGVPDVLVALARVYGELGWQAEHSLAIKTLLERFPNDMAALHAAVDVYEAEGDTKTVDGLLARIQKLDRDDEIRFTRALARQDYKTAIAELERIAKLHPEQKDIPERIDDVNVRAGSGGEVWKKLEAAVKSDPSNEKARLELADAHYAHGDQHALSHALAESVEAGADSRPIANAIDVVEGATELEPYRLDAMKIIDAFEKSGKEMPGTAARILDYAALWVRADGSSRMLEHEIVRLQSAESISTFAEHRALEGLVLHMRVIKKDRTTLEPEAVSGKPTVTFPHLEVGDYIETEQVIFSPSEGHGEQYLGPRWFFREENVGYARSEFVVISPTSKDLVVETTGKVPDPVVETHDGLVTHRWRVDYSPAAPTEPGSVPITEFLPSVHIGWGVTLERRLQAIADALAPLAPVDPRIRAIAENIAAPLPASDQLGRAKRLYRWLLDNVEPGDEADGRRVVIGKHGNLWHGFKMLCRALDIPVSYAVAQSRLSPPPEGPLSRAVLFVQPVARIDAKAGAAWLTLGNKYAPFGYVPADVRGMPARLLDDPTRETTVPQQGGADGISFSGKGQLDAKGQLVLELVQEFTGRLAIALRRGLSQVPDRELHDVLEQNLLAQTLRGGELTKYSVEHRDDVDSPLVIRMSVKVARFAQSDGKTLVVSPPLAPDLGAMASLPERQTPLLIPEALHRRIGLDISLPAGATIAALGPVSLNDGDRRVVIQDTQGPGLLEIRRSVDIPAGRVHPEDYPRFARFAQQADDALSRTIEVRLHGS